MVLRLRLRVACNSQPSALGFYCARKLVEDARNLWADAKKFKCNSHFKFMPSVRLCRNPFGNAKNFYCCLKIAGAMPWICMLKDFYSECNCAGFYNRNVSKISFLQLRAFPTYMSPRAYLYMACVSLPIFHRRLLKALIRRGACRCSVVCCLHFYGVRLFSSRRSCC